MNIYEISYPGVLDEYPDYSVIRTAETAGKAKYGEYLRFSDGDGTSFSEFLQLIRVKKIGSSDPGARPVPSEIQRRIDIVHALVREIGSRSHRFLYSVKKERYALFHWADGRIWYTDEYHGRPFLLDKDIPDEGRHFSNGGTLWGLVGDFRDFIGGDDDANHNNGYGGLYCTHWGYPEEDMEAIREKARALGYLKAKPVSV